MLGRADSWPFGWARRGFAFILGGVVAALLLQGLPASAQEAQSAKPSTDAPSTAGSEAAPSTDTSTSSTTVAAPQAAAAALPDDPPSNPDSLRPSDGVNGANASFTTNIPLQVPPFHGLEPSLALAYDSGRGNGFVGVGWTLAAPSAIERGSVRRGAPRYDTTDVFYLDGSEMVACAGITSPGCSAGGTHATRIESFLRIKQVTASNTWEVTRRDGTKLTYGALSTWCSYNSGNADEVKEATNFRWALKTAVDTHGNTVTYAYTCDGVPNQYIDTITYNGNTIKFYREARTDDLSYATGAGLGSWNFRLKTVDVKVGTSRVRTYTLAYNVTETARSRLISVQQFGKDAVVNGTTGAVTGGTSLPAIVLTQSATQIGYNRTSWGTWTAGTNPTAVDWLRGDFNGDGKDDLAQLMPEPSFASNCTVYTMKSTGSSFTFQKWNVVNSGNAVCPSTLPSTQRFAADVTGDGKDDIVVDAGHGDVHVLVSGPANVFLYQTWVSSDGSSSTAGWVPADVNGDGKADFLQRQIVSSGCQLSGLVSTGNGLTRKTWTLSVSTCPNPAEARFLVGDFNGDGKTDFAAVNNSGALQAVVFLANASGDYGSGADWAPSGASATSGKWFAGDVDGDGSSDLVAVYLQGSTVTANVHLSSGSKFVSQVWATTSWDSSYLSRVWAVGDVNGDRRADFIAADINSGHNTVADVLESTGTAFTARSWANISNTGGDAGLAGDFNGDGRTDMSMLQKTGSQWWPNYVLTAGGVYPDLLASLKNPLGGTTSIAYTPSSAWTNTYLPFILQTATSVTRNDGRTATAATSYAYTGGLWNWTERRFLGFLTSTATLPCITGESTCPKRISTYVQSKAAYSPLAQYDEQDANNTLMHRRVEEWTLTTATLPYKALNTASWQYLYAGSSNKRTKVTRSFDSYGNVTQQTAWGNFDQSGDERTVQTDYSANTTAYIVGLAGRVQAFSGSTTGGTKLAETQILYDNAAAYTTAPTKGDATGVRRWLDTTGGYLASTAGYDSFGNRTSATTPLGDRTDFLYDTTYHVFPIETHDPLYIAGDTRHKTTALWDVVCAQPTEKRDFNNLPTTQQYDQLCRPIRTDTPGGGFAILSYNSIGTPTTQYLDLQTPPADGSGNIWARQYFDGYGRIYEALSKGPATGQEIRVDTAYNARSRVASQTAPYYAGGTVYTTTFGYDAIDRPTQRKYPDNATVQGAYALGAGIAIANVTITDELGRTTATHIDGFGRAVRSEQQLGGSPVVTTYSYDLLNRLTGLTDDAGNAWSYGYDSLSRALTANDPDLGAWSFRYDDSSRPTLQTDALGQKIRLTYDSLDRLLTRTARADTPQAVLTTYTYDEARSGFFNVGGLTTATNPAATIQTSFDNEGRLAQKTYVVDGSNYGFGTTYDAGGRILSQSYPDGDSVGGGGSPILYDAAGRPKAVPGLASGGLYDARGNLTSLTRANGTTSTLGYSPQRGWLTSIQTTAGATTLQDLTYTRGANGRINGMTSSQPGEGWTYGYNDLDELTTATNATDPLLTQSFGYDRVGNMTSNSAIGTYSYPATGSPRPHAVNATPLGSYGYDANGNMTSALGDTLTYDGDNLLASVNAVSFVYGPDGERLKKIAGGTTTLYLGDDVEITGGVVAKYLPGDAKRVGLATYWLHRDHLGSVRVVTDGTGTVVNRANYRPYGERLVSVPTLPENKAYIGERLDDETGLMYLHARYFDPALGRFIQADPIGPAGGLNLYAYASNSPINRADPLGQQDSFSYDPGLNGGGGGDPDQNSSGGGNVGNTTGSNNGNGGAVVGGGNGNPGAAGGLGGGAGIGSDSAGSDPGSGSASGNGVSGANTGGFNNGGGNDPRGGDVLGSHPAALQCFGRCHGFVVNPNAIEATPENSPFLFALGEALPFFVPVIGEEVGLEYVLSRELVPVAAKTLGEWGEVRLAEVLGRQGVKPGSPFRTTLGPRYVDRLINGVAYESKAGLNVGLTGNIRGQIAKDVELIRSGQVRGVEWHFWRGVQPELVQALQQAGIKVVVH